MLSREANNNGGYVAHMLPRDFLALCLSKHICQHVKVNSKYAKALGNRKTRQGGMFKSLSGCSGHTDPVECESKLSRGKQAFVVPPHGERGMGDSSDECLGDIPNTAKC